MKSSGWVFAFLSVSAVPVACGFPMVGYIDGNGGNAGSGSSQHGGSSASSNPTNSGGMSSTMSNGGNPTGPGGSNAGGGGSGPGGTTSSTGSGGNLPCAHRVNDDDCDCDGDGHRKPTCTVGPNSEPNDDCADYDERAFPGQVKFYSSEITGPVTDGTLPFDFNCDGFQTQEYPAQLKCTVGLACGSVTTGWKAATIPDCGDVGTLLKCTGLCSKANLGMTKQPCN